MVKLTKKQAISKWRGELQDWYAEKAKPYADKKEIKLPFGAVPNGEIELRKWYKKAKAWQANLTIGVQPNMLPGDPLPPPPPPPPF